MFNQFAGGKNRTTMLITPFLNWPFGWCNEIVTMRVLNALVA